MPNIRALLLCKDDSILVDNKIINLRELRKATWINLERFLVCK